MNLTEEQHDLLIDGLYEMARQNDQVAESCERAAANDVLPIRQDAWTRAADQARERAEQMRDLAGILSEAERLALYPDVEMDPGEAHGTESEVVETDFAVAPGEYLAEYIESRGLSVEEFAGTSAFDVDLVKGLLAASVTITHDIADRLSGATAIPTDSWLRLENAYRADLERLTGREEQIEQKEQ